MINQKEFNNFMLKNGYKESQILILSKFISQRIKLSEIDMMKSKNSLHY